MVTTALVGCEIALRIFAANWPRAEAVLGLNRVTMEVPDSLLGFRPNPAFPGHDSNGFRNPTVPQSAEIVTIGDSQTYGTGVADDESWPRVLERISTGGVYNISFGGWGPVESLILLDDAWAFRPKTILVSFYAGNDLYDSFGAVYKRGLRADLKSGDAKRNVEIEEAELSQPIAALVSQANPMSNGHLRTSLAKHSSLYGLLRGLHKLTLHRFGLQNNWSARIEAVKQRHASYEPWESASLKTVFSPGFRFAAVNLDDPRINEGFQISLKAFSAISRETRARHARLVIVMIPTKESVFAPEVSSKSSEFKRLNECERQVWEASMVHFRSERIEFIDSMPTLRRLVRNGIQPYPASPDGHPNAKGQAAIAAVVATYLTE